MSELEKPSINADTEMPKSTKIKIAIGVCLFIAILALVFIAHGRVSTIETPPAVQETIPPELELNHDNLYIAKSSWRDGSWCAVDKESVTGIYIVEKYEGSADTVWSVDEMIFFQDTDGGIYIQAGPGVHMLGSMRAAFAYFPNATVLSGLEKLETSSVTDMSYIFAESAFESIDISTWDTSSVTNFSYMLYNTKNTKNINMNNLDLSRVVDVSYMFAKCHALENIYFENVDTSHILLMEGMFEYVGSGAPLASTTLHGTLNTDSCTNMAKMFSWTSLGNILDVIKDFNTSNVTTMEGMFENSLDTYELDLSSWDVSKVTNMNHMFSDSICLISLNMEGWEPTNLESADYMFQGCYNLREFNQWGAAPNIKSTDHMFENCFEMLVLDVTCFDGAVIEKAERMFYCTQYVEYIYSNGFTITEPAFDMFTYCDAIKGPTPFDGRTGSDMATTTGYFTPTK